MCELHNMMIAGKPVPRTLQAVKILYCGLLGNDTMMQTASKQSKEGTAFHPDYAWKQSSKPA
jgi:hypothetical protein